MAATARSCRWRRYEGSSLRRCGVVQDAGEKRAPRRHRAAPIGADLLCVRGVVRHVCLLAQWLRPDLDWRHAPLSNYLKGHYGGWVRGAYYVLSMALVLLGAGLYGALRPHARSAAPLLLLVVAGVGLWATAITETICRT